MAKPLKVTVTITVEIADPDEWATTFGTEGRAAIRGDVKSYIGNAIQHSGAFGSGEVQAEITWR